MSKRQDRQYPLQANIGQPRQIPNTIYRTYVRPIDLNVAVKSMISNQKKKCYNCDKKGHFVKDYRQPKKLSWKLIPQKNANIVNTECNIVMIKRMLFFIDFENVFISVSLNVLDIEPEEDLDIDESEEFNTGV